MRLNFPTRCARSGTTSAFDMVSGGSAGRVETTGGVWSALDCCDVFDWGGFDCCGFDCCAVPIAESAEVAMIPAPSARTQRRKRVSWGSADFIVLPCHKPKPVSRTWSLDADGAALEAGGEGLLLCADRGREAVAEFGEEFGSGARFFQPVGGIDAEEFVEGAARNRKAVERERFGRGNQADRRFVCGGAAFDPVEHPLQHADIFPVTWPEKFSIRVLAEPVHVEDFRRVLDFRAHREPVAKIVSHVVAAEGKHGHGIAARDADGACRGGGGFRGHGGADENSVLPVARLIDERRDARAASAENDRGDRNA